MLDTNEKYGFSTTSIHAGEADDQYGALVQPIYQTSTFKFKTTDEAAEACEHLAEHFGYSRITNPSCDYFEKKLAAIEHGKGAVAFASGVGAIAAAFMSILKAGDHVIFGKAVYSAVEHMANSILPKFGIETTQVDTSKPEEIEKAIKPNTVLIYFETPANPTMLITDIQAVVDIAKKHGIRVGVDNTFASPYITNPLDYGVDYVVQSCTKYIGGHGDVVAGALISNDDELLKLFRLEGLMHFGAVMSPFTTFLLARGIKSLECRMKQHSENALKIAQFLETSDKVSKVYYPFLESNPQYEIAKKQMRLGGGMITFDIADGLEAGRKFMNNLKICTIAVSLGDTETLVEQAAAMTHTMVDKKVREEAGITDGLIRMSVGLENVDDLIADIKQALDKI